QLRRWLGDDAARLADGSPIDYALFDDAILSVQERVAPAAGAQGLGQLLRAARQVAETIYARAPRKTVASEENLRVAGAQEPECTQMYMRIPSTAGAQIIERSRFFEVPARNRLP
ncbi:hypothetical protein, partial [Rudaea sp.]|uniref:hypothetical protein n=1 Tax=Rudaea sp. TaxID=2136325 RepID=UPI0032204C86